MAHLLANWLKMNSLVTACLAAQQPTQPPALATANAYVRRIDADRTLTELRHMQTYGHPLRPGSDSLLLDYSSDFPSSTVFYYANQQLVKIIETARTSRAICENSYYLKNNQLVLVSQKQVACPIERQRAIWFQKMPINYSAKDCYFTGTYFFAADSCIAQHERGKPEFKVGSLRIGKQRGITLCHFFPLQAARYVTAFGHPSRRH